MSSSNSYHGVKSSIEVQNVAQSFSNGERDIVLFDDLSFSIHQGESYAITGPSGSGKSSLLMLASGLELPSNGSVFFRNATGAHTIDHVRKEIGFIFQQFHLLPELDALNNVALPLKLRGRKDAISKAIQWLDKVGLGNRLHHKPSQLSGGEQQRVAIARALVFSPAFIFADEPTGNLDAQSANEIANLLFACCEENGAGLVLVTHSEALARKARHQLQFSNGQCSLSSIEERGKYYA
ncbi:ABC transporter ATP-binding protein [Alteromonas gracilis]|uniref:ABC transporter ATP-binding protein n=1 Tax=Alteromonas gracilis TaxID=1479524 RepID=UPI00373649BD